ncbi:MAG: terminase small subunit [Lachnospiraceae bacterium]|nr:terminase small subunit [Lachnospiraceae bacterium]
MLTPKQERFVQELVKGKSQRQAYRSAYPSSLKWNDNSVDNKASLLLKNVKVRQRYEELQKKVESRTVYDAAEVRNTIISTMMAIVNADVADDNVDGRAVKNKRWDSRNRVVYDHYDKIEASKMLIGLLGIENVSEDSGVHIHLHSSEDYDE